MTISRKFTPLEWNDEDAIYAKAKLPCCIKMNAKVIKNHKDTGGLQLIHGPLSIALTTTFGWIYT
jgi:hypothetical protein